MKHAQIDIFSKNVAIVHLLHTSEFPTIPVAAGHGIVAICKSHTTPLTLLLLR